MKSINPGKTHVANDQTRRFSAVAMISLEAYLEAAAGSSETNRSDTVNSSSW